MRRISLLLGIIFLAAAVSAGAWTKLTTVGAYQGTSVETKPLSAIIGSTYKCTDTGLIYEWTGTTWVIPAVVSVTDTTRKTAPGVSAAVSTKGYQKLTLYFTVYNINTSVTVGLQARTTNTAWRYVEGASTYTANGDYGLTWAHAATSDSVRWNWSAEVGGTDAIVTGNFALSGGE